LGEALRKAVENKKERHQLLNRLAIGLPPAPTTTIALDVTSSSSTTDQAPPEEETKPKEIHLPKISPLPGYVGDPFTEAEIGKLKAGAFLFHLNYGKGKVIVVKNTGKDKLASIEFESGTKMLVLTVSDLFRKTTD